MSTVKLANVLKNQYRKKLSESKVNKLKTTTAKGGLRALKIVLGAANLAAK